MMSVLLGLVLFIYNVSSLLILDLFPGIKKTKLHELHDTFNKLFDKNNDNIIRFNEILIGIQTNINETNIDYIPNKYSCIPSLDFIDFADCITISSRIYYKNNINNINTNKEYSFNELFLKYIGKCNDIPHENVGICSDMVHNNEQYCAKYKGLHCQLSCYSCKHESTIFGDDSIRGLDGKLYDRPEKLPQLIENFEAEYCKTEHPSNHSGNILFVSDIHVEPWYNVNGTGEVSRFSGADVNNMFECKNSDGKVVDCTLNGESDPPMDLFKTGMEYLRDHRQAVEMSRNILIMGGDTQAHDYTTGVLGSETETVPDLLSPVVQEMLSVGFIPDNIFYAAGNNDGQHNSIFCKGSDPAINSAWANVLIKANIVTNKLKRVYTYESKNYTSIQLFNKTGYYIKKIPPIFDNSNLNENFYAIILNTNLGSSNSLQNSVFNDDLEWIYKQANGHLIVIGHHPNIVSTIIPSKYKSIVRGSFSGHVHYFQPTNPDDFYFAILPATTQYAVYSAVINGEINDDGNIVLNFDNNFNEYFGKKGYLPSEKCWGYNGNPSNK